MGQLESYFAPFRKAIVGDDFDFVSPFGKQRMLYTDWTASGRLYRPIEETMLNTYGPLVGNTHSESNLTGSTMTLAYHDAQVRLKRHVNAGPDDVIISRGSGMTAVVNKLQRILGLKVSDLLLPYLNYPDSEKPVVFITHMEHSSNQTSWQHTLADVVCIQPDATGNVDLDHLRDELKKHSDRKVKIGAFTACSNVTGIHTPLRQLARIMHEHDGLCFGDFAGSAPYVEINMHPGDEMERLDAVYFSPHKFLGGPGTPGVLVFDKTLYKCKVPDEPGGGTVDWTNSWSDDTFVTNIEAREDGGTPGFLQVIKAALTTDLKDQMGVANIRLREEELIQQMFEPLQQIPKLYLLANKHRERLPFFSFFLDGVHFNLVVSLLNDRYGIQARGGSSCAGTYGHYLLNDDMEHCQHLSYNPGWVRISLHPTTRDEECLYILNALSEISEHVEAWEKDYNYDLMKNEYTHRGASELTAA